MSGYNKKTGIFGLTATKAEHWFQRKDVPAECLELKGMEFYACALRLHGLEVVHVADSYLNVKAETGPIWEALSGQPSDPKRTAYYAK